MSSRLLGFAAMIGVVLLTSCTEYKGTFSLVNRAAEPITHASVTICGQTLELTGIQTNGSVAGSYRVTSDSHYTIPIEFRSGKSLSEDTGYVTNGTDFHHDIAVTDSGIEISGGAIK